MLLGMVVETAEIRTYQTWELGMGKHQWFLSGWTSSRTPTILAWKPGQNYQGFDPYACYKLKTINHTQHYDLRAYETRNIGVYHEVCRIIGLNPCNFGLNLVEPRARLHSASCKPNILDNQSSWYLQSVEKMISDLWTYRTWVWHAGGQNFMYLKR